MNGHDTTARRAAQPGPLLTVAIPYYSSPEYLLQALRSVLALDNPAWCLRIYDDNPEQPLDTGLIEPYLGDPRISYRRNASNLGIGGNWNQCLDECTTPLLTILHSDDLLQPNYLDLALATLEAEPAAWAFFCGAHVIDAQGRSRFSAVDFAKRFFRPRGDRILLQGEDGANALLRGNFIMCPTVCYRLRDIGELRFDQRWRMVLDLDFYLRLLRRGGSLAGSAEVAYCYRRHASSQTAAMNENLDRFEEEVELYRELGVSLAEGGWPRAAATAGGFRIVRLHMLFLAVTELLRFHGGGARRIWRRLRSL